MEREKFEESWKDAFDKAQVSPSDQVWNNIELDLEKAKGSDLKRRLMFYQMVAAASIVFAMAIGGVGYYNAFYQNNTNVNNLAERSPSASETQSTENRQPSAVNQRDNEIVISENTQSEGTVERQATSPGNADVAVENNTVREDQFQAFSSERNQSATGNVSRTRGSGNSENGETALLAGSTTSGPLPDFPRGIDERDLPPLYTPQEIRLAIVPSRQEEVDPVLAMLAELEQREKEIQGEEKTRKEKSASTENLWTSVGFAAGSFNNVQAGPSTAPSTMSLSAAAPIVDQETSASGYSYSMGVNVGTRLSERWVFQGGVNYLTHASEYTANNVIVASTGYQQQQFRAVSTNELIGANVQDLNSKIVYSAPYNINNSMRYLSIPMQAGYLLVNKTFGLQLNAGVATDLFLQNTIDADSDLLAKTSQSGGADSPYRAVNLSGLFGTEVSYRFGENYRISLNPGIRYPFNTIYKSELGVQSTPLTFDVGLRFRYIFH